MAIFKVTAVPDFSQLRGEIARLQGSPVTLGVDTRQANVDIKATTKEIKNAGKAAKETSGFADLMGDSFGRVAAKMVMWQVMGNAIAGVKREFTEALKTMKSVDDEMVTIRKVTGASKDELEKIEKQAYKTASAYGVAADEYLKFVSGFSRAGYGEQASALAELATKTQIVGDTNAETAQQFLLSVDAAYKYQGNIEKLTAVLDGANEIDNRYATSISKIAEGLGKVAPIAAQAHVGVDELTAAIGTITAVTQRSGTEAATALRALFLNIIGDTKTEIDEGVTWTTGEIAGLRDVIKLYAKDAYEAAQASGDVINPMKAIAGLSKSMKDGFLTEQKLMEMVSDIGGKLRTSQLLALIQNWDMYESMLTDFAGAAGSADKEVENALDSWTRKTEILKNKWTEFVSHLVETDTIKGALDGVIKLVEFLDSDTGRLVVQMGLLVGTLALLNKGFTSLMTKTAVGTFFGTLTSAIGGNAMATTQLIGQLKSLVAILPQIGIGAAIFAALAAAIYVGTQKQREYNNALKETEEIQSKLGETQSEYDGLINKTGELTAEEKKRLEVLKELRKEQEKQLEAAKKAEWTAWNKLHGSGAKTVVGGGEGVGGGLGAGALKTERMDIETLRNYREELTAIEAQYRAGEMSAGAYYDALEKLNAAREDSVETIRAAIDAGYEVTEEQRELVAAYDRVQQTLGVTQNATKDYISELIEEARQSGATGKALYDLVAAQITASSTGLDVSQQIAALQALAVQAGYTAQAIAQVFAYANGAGTYQADSAEIKQRAQELMESGAVSSVSQAFNLAKKQLTEEAWGNLTGNYTPSVSVPSVSYPRGGGYSSGGYSGGGSSSRGDGGRQNAQAQIKKLQKERDAELAVIQKQIDALKEQTEEEDRQAKLEEYKLEILKKQDAVMNARNERTVRQYNASTGQWEWVADATKVKKAEEDLENAKKELREYERKVEIDLAVDELKARQDAIKAAYQIKIDAWQDYLDGLSSAISTEKSMLDQSVANNQAAANDIIKAWNEANKAKENGSSSGDVQSPGDGSGDVQSPGGTDESVYSPSNVSESDIKVMQAYLGTGIDGKWGSKSEAALKNSRFSSFDEAYKHFSFVAYDKAVAAVRDGNSKATQQFKGMQQQGYADIVAYASVARMMGYDEGGILKGMGGIKATPKDEIVLPPKLAAKMLTPLADRTFKARLGELGFLYGAETGLPRTLTGSSDNRSYTDNSGTRYQIGSIVMTEQQAKHTTIYEAAQQAHNLQAFNA
nr:MAG TPA: minor tail protein [Caudoviricetes sp.]